MRTAIDGVQGWHGVLLVEEVQVALFKLLRDLGVFEITPRRATVPGCSAKTEPIQQRGAEIPSSGKAFPRLRETARDLVGEAGAR
jgi:hypothetical protein